MGDGSTGIFAKRYRTWGWLQSSAIASITVLAIASELVTSRRVATLPAPVWTGLAACIATSMVALYLLGARHHPNGTGNAVANAITSVRLVATVLLFGFLPTMDGRSWLLVTLVAAAELSDLFDGWIARRWGGGGFGSVWDMEHDALFTWTLSIVVWQVAGVPSFVVLIGLMRYLYFMGWHFPGDPPEHPARYKLFAKTVAATLVIALIVALAPVVPRSVAAFILAGALTLQVISFGWDLLLWKRAAGT